MQVIHKYYIQIVVIAKKTNKKGEIMTVIDKIKMLDKEQLENILIALEGNRFTRPSVTMKVNKAYRKSLPFGLKGENNE